MSGRGRYLRSKSESDRHAARNIDSVFSGASLVNMAAQPNSDDLQAKRRADYDEWIVREVDRGLAAAERGEFGERAAVRRMIDERYPG